MRSGRRCATPDHVAQQTAVAITMTAVVTTVALAVLAFAASYAALADWAHRHEHAGWVGYVWPLFLDGFVLVGSLFVLRAALAGRRAWYPLVLVVLGNLASVAFNVAHVHTLAGRITAVVPPLAALAVFELATRELYKALKSRPVLAGDTKSGPGPRTGGRADRTRAKTGPVGEGQLEHGRQGEEVRQVGTVLPSVGTGDTELQGVNGPGRTDRPDPERAHTLARQGWEAGRPAAEIARRIGRDASLVRRWYRAWQTEDSAGTGPGTDETAA